ncbi:proliferation marker protein Ki-67 isoform X2 [Dipodomys merriami]|uniref:proliferation marker protein Ki-67 isoform X2 n=1 Tax=Dipodomys merriami TaxID=94247 RepID=UPI003855A856
MGPPGLVTIKRSGLDGARFPLSLRSCSFGRDIECDIRIQLPVVSKLHCRIEVSGQEATLYNFSSTNPTQLNGSAIDKPVHLKHGDVITIIDRSFRYEKESPQNESKPDEFPGKRQEQARARRSSRSSLSTPPDGKAQGSRTHSKVTASRSQEPGKELMGDSATPDGSEHRAAPQLLHACSPEQVGNDGGKAGRPTPRGPKENSRVTARDLKSLPLAQSLDNSKDTESPFEKLYQSMKEELSLSLRKQSLAQTRRKSGLQLDSATEKERRENLPWGSHKARPRSADTLCIKAASSFTPETNQTQEKGISADPAHTSDEALNSSISVAETTTKSPGRYSQPRKDTGLYITGGEAVNLGPGEGIGSADRPVTPRRRLTGNRPSAIAGDTASPAGQPDSLSSKSRSVPAEAERRPPEVRKEPFVTQCFPRTESKISKDFLDEPNKLAVKSGQIGSGLPGLSSVDISNFGDSINKSEGASLKRRRVSFGGRLRPELFDENLPPNTPLKRGETPSKRKLPVTHTPAVLKKIIKPPSGEEESSEICVEVTAQDVCTGAVASSLGVTQPGVNGQRRRSGKASTASGVSGSPGQTDAPKRAGRKSVGSASKRTSISRGQHDILQRICSKRRSGASEANLIVAKSWADVVKLGAKQTQVRVPKHGPPKPVGRRQRKPSTPKKPTASVRHQFSTGHANSPCTIVIGKAQTEKVSIPARPSRMLNSFVFNRKMDYSEDLSGITELFKTPVKEKPQTTGPGSFTLSSPENLTGKQFQGVNSGENPLCTTSETWVFSSQNSAEEPSDKCSESHTIKQQSREDRSTAKTPQNMPKTTHPERKTPDAVKEPLNTVPSASRLRQSRELRSSQTPPVRSKNGGSDGPPAEGVTDTPLRKTPLRARKVEGEDSAGSAETGRKRDKSTESAAKETAVRRSRSEGQKLGPKELPGPPAHAKEPGNEAEQTTGTDSSPQGADLTNTRKRPPKTEDSKEDAPHVSHQPTHTNLTPGTPRPHGDPAACAARVKKGPRTPKKQTQPLEDLVGFAELFQTPGQPMAHEKAKVPRKSPQPMPISTKAPPVTPSRKMDASELSALRKFAHISVGDTHAPKVTQPDVISIRALKEPAKQIVHPVGNVTGSKRQQETPKEKTQLEDLAGFQELLQTPGLSKDLVITDRTTKRTREAPQATTARTPGSTQRQPRTRVGNVDVKAVSSLRKLQQSPGKALQTPTAPEEEGLSTAFVQTPEQTPDMTGDLTGSKRRPRTSKGRSLLLGDLSGFQELFQTPEHSSHQMIVIKPTAMPRKAPQSEPVKVPTGVKRQPRTSVGNMAERELSSLRKLQQSPGKALQTPTAPEEEGLSTAFVQTPEQTPDMTGDLTGSKRRPRTSKGRSLLLGDLSGFQELFQTPEHSKDPRTPGEATEMSPEPVKTPRSTRRRSKMSLGKAHTEGRLPGLGELSQVLQEPKDGVSGTRAGKLSTKRKLSSEASVTVSKRLRRTPREKAQPLEDLSFLQQLFQTPGHAQDTTAADGTTETASTSAKPGAVRTPRSTQRQPRASLGHLAVKEELSPLRKQRQSAVRTHTLPQPGGASSAIVLTPEQKPHLQATSTGSRRRTPERRGQSPGDLPGLQELFQTPDHSKGSKTVNRSTEVSGRSPQPEPVRTPAGVRRQPRPSLENVNVKVVSSLKKLQLSPGKALQIPTAPEEEELSTAFMQTPEQTPDMTGDLTGSKRRPRTSKGRSLLLGDLSGFQELFQTPERSSHQMIVIKPTATPSNAPQSEPVKVPTGVKRQPRTSVGNVDVKAVSSLRKLQQSPGKALQTPTAPEEEGLSTAFVQTPEQTPDMTGDLTGSKRRPRTSKGRSLLLGDLSGFQELFQTPEHSSHQMIVIKPTAMPRKAPQSEPVKVPTGVKRQPRTSMGNIAERELSSLRKLQQSPGKALQTPTAPEEEGLSTTFVQTPEQTPDMTGDLTGSKRRPRTSKGRSLLLGDLSGFQELFQTPEHSKDPRTPGEATEMSPEPVKTPRSTRRRSKMSLGKAHTEGRLPGLGELSQVLHEPKDGVSGTRAGKLSTKRKLSSEASVTVSKRLRRTPREKAQPLEDLSFLQQLFQTPGHAQDTTAADGTTETASTSAKPGAVRTPRSTQRQPRASLGHLAVKEELSPLRKQRQSAVCTHTLPQPGGASSALVLTPEQKPHLQAISTGSRRRTPERRGQSPGDLPGLQELFQTPDHSKGSKTVNRSTEVSGRSPQPEPVRTPAGVRRQPRPSRGNDVEEETKQRSRSLSGAAKSSPEVTQRKAALGESTMQTPRTVANRQGHRKQPRAPKERSQPLEDLSGLQELFRTPGLPKDSIAMEITGLPGTSPQSEPGRPSRPSLGTLRVKEELPAPPEMTAALEETTQTHRVPDGEVTVPKAGEVSARPARDPARRAGSRLRRMTPKEKAQPLEDLSGLQELFQTPGRREDPVPRAAPQPPPTNSPATAKRRARASLGKAPTDGEPTRTPQVPGGEDGARVVKPRAKRKLDPADSVTGSKGKRLRGGPGKAPSPDAQAGLQELLGTKDTNTPRQPLQPEPQDTSVPLKRVTRTRRGTVDTKEELPAAKTLTRASRQATRTRKALEGKVTDIQVSKESAKQVPDPAKSITGTRKLRGARKESTRPLDSLAASNETIQPPAHTEDSGSDASAGRIPHQSPQPEPDTDTASRRPLRTRRGNAVVSKETSGPARETRKTAGKPMHSGEGVTLLEEPLQPELAPAARVARPKRLRGAAAEKAPPLNPASLPEALQTPAHTEDPADDEKSTNTPRQPAQPEPQDTSVPWKRATRSRRGTVDTKEELPVARTLTRASKQTTRTRKVLEGDVTDSQASKESAKQAFDPANNVTGTRRLRGARKESTQPLGGPAAPKETVQPPVHTEELTNSAVTPKPLKASRRVLRAPKEKPVTSLIPKQEPGEDGPGVQSSVTATPASSEEKPAVRPRPRPPRPLKMLKCLRVLAPKIHLREEQSCNSTEAEDGEPREAPAAANQRMSLRTRHPQNPRAGQQSPEGLGSAEKVTEKRNAKKPEKTSQDTEPQNQENGGQQPATRGQVRGGRGGLRSGGQSKASTPLPAEDKVKESQESSSRGQNESGARPDVRGLRAKRTAIQPAGSTLDSEPKPRVTRGAKRGAENPKKADNTVSSKRVRTRRPLDGEDV